MIAKFPVFQYIIILLIYTNLMINSIADQVELQEELNFHGVHLLKRMIFPLNSSLLDDIIALDHAYNKLVQTAKSDPNKKFETTQSNNTAQTVMNTTKITKIGTEISKMTKNNMNVSIKILNNTSNQFNKFKKSTGKNTTPNPAIKIVESNINFTNTEKIKVENYDKNNRDVKNAEQPRLDMTELEMRLLVVGDHSMYEKFLGLYGQDHFVAYNALHRYLTAIFDQIHAIFSQIRFFNRFPITLKLAEVLPLFRAEDCPFRMPYLKAKLIEEILQKERKKIQANFDDNVDRSNSTKNSTQIDEEEYNKFANGSLNEMKKLNINTNTTKLALNFDSVTTSDDIIFDDFHLNSTLIKENDQEIIDMRKLSWTKISGLAAIHMLHDWERRIRRHLSKHEHILIITNYDLLTQNKESATQGMAYVRGMCRAGDSASVVEDIGGLATAIVASHEIVHNLGAFHDGTGTNQPCPASSNFLMSPSSSSADFGPNFENTFLLSECSLREIHAFLNSEDSNCLRRNFIKDMDYDKEDYYKEDEVVRYFEDIDQSDKDKSKEEIKLQPGKTRLNFREITIPKRDSNDAWTDRKNEAKPMQEFLGSTTSPKLAPGQIFDVNQQCKIAFGAHYGACRRHHSQSNRFLYDKNHDSFSTNKQNLDPCRRLWCKNRRERRQKACETKSFLPLMDGTSCGNPNRWCLRGVCVAQSNSSFTRDCRNINDAYCSVASQQKRVKFCATKLFAHVCCALCMANYNGTRNLLERILGREL